ncbi:hypothetical protein OG331_50485 [Streptomyces sp. NBC_01017]|uniref:hypothetical protein n=1 Tax=Streptomyces sp. NBC_01017 TaxID=2903721 RepID=UPI00386CBF22|nr:hypothetical protein OG331_01490 [Streptomyces sp. NBC_01017]WSV35168.1 hypothetical protein OG331_50485 [Streptomyces sp. NBC_01017]
MTQKPRTTPPTAHHQRPFTRDPGRWEKESSRALRAGHVRNGTCSAACQPVLVHERTSWGWLAWTVPGDGTPPELPVQIGVLAPEATRTQRLAARWLLRRPAHRIALAPASRVSLRFTTTAVAAIALVAALYAPSRGIPVGLVLLAPLLTEHLPDRLDERAGEYVRSVEGDAACRYLQRLADLHTGLVDAAAGSDRYALLRSAEMGHHLLWDAADLLQAYAQDTRLVSAQLIDRERLMVQLANQVARDLERIRARPASGQAGQPHGDEGALGPLPPGFERVTPSRPESAHCTSPLKGSRTMAKAQSDDSVRATDVYLLFAHELYYPGEDAHEINTSVVAAASLLHPKVHQPDGARIHERLTQGRRPGEIVPLATLTHELDGGAQWPYVGDWEKVTTDLVRLVRTAQCDALSLGLPEIARALICTGPNNHVRTLDTAAGQSLTYGPKERAAVLAEIDTYLACLVAEQDLWPGDDLLPPLFRHP